MENLKLLIKKDAINEIKSFVSFNKFINNHDIKNNSFDLLIYTIKEASCISTIKYILSVYHFLYKNLNYAIDSGESPLAVALSLNKLILADYLIEHKANVNFCNYEGDNILAFLYKNSLLSNVSLKYLLNHKVEINSIDSNGNSFLTLIINNNNVAFSKILHTAFDMYHNDFVLKLIGLSKFQIDISDSKFKELFNIERKKSDIIQIKDKDIINSCMKQSLDIVKLGFSNSINTEYFKRIDNAGLLCKLYEKNRRDILKFLVDKGAFINQIETSDRSIFLKTIYAQDLEMAKYLISKGMDVNGKVKNWSNICYPYIYYVSNDEFYKLLIKHGADLYMPDNEYSKVLKIVNSSHSVAEYLTKHNYYSNSHIGNEYHCTFYSACRHGNMKIIKHLLRAKIPYLTNGLIYACKNGNTDIVQLLINRGADVNHFNKGYAIQPTPLEMACMNNHEKVVKILLENGALVNPKQSNGEPLYDKSYLMMACECNNEKIIDYLIKYGSEINEINSEGETLLMFACKNKYENIARNILLKKIMKKTQDAQVHDQIYDQVHAQDIHGNTALAYACQNGLTEIVKILIDHYQVDVNTVNESNETPLILACKNRYPDIVKLLIHHSKSQPNPNYLDDNNKSPLMYALITQNNESIQDLLSLDQTLDKDIINYPTQNNKTLLMYVCQYSSLELVKKLIEHHADLNKRNNKGETAFLYACQYGNDEMVNYLIEKGANINDISNTGDTSLMYAIKGNNIKIVNILLKKNHVNWNKKNNVGETAMMYACRFGYDEIVENLIEKGIIINEVNHNGDTPLIYACRNGHKECVQLLINHDCPLDYKGYKGKTALINACEHGKLDIVKLLIPYHININIRDFQGKTALIHAREKNYSKIVKYLTGYMEHIIREEENKEKVIYDGDDGDNGDNDNDDNDDDDEEVYNDYDKAYDDYDNDFLYTTSKVSLKLNKIRKKKVKNMNKIYENDNKSMRKILNIKYSDDFYIQ